MAADELEGEQGRLNSFFDNTTILAYPEGAFLSSSAAHNITNPMARDLFTFFRVLSQF